jgi:hypothetical protein
MSILIIFFYLLMKKNSGHVNSLKILLFPSLPFISKKNFSPVKSRVDHLYPYFYKKRHGKTRHVLGSHGITRDSHGKVRTKGA